MDAITLAPQSRRAAYFKMRMVGKGTYGSVHLVKCRDDGKLYVMKTVKNMTVEAGEKHQIEALREVKVLEQLKHPNVVGFVEAFLSGDKKTLYIVMQYCESGDLEKRIKSARRKAQYFSENQIIDWALQICLALKYLHDRKILHRDLKPQNVFLTENNKVVKLGDFGIVKVLEKTAAMAVTKVGTPYYFSPELCRNRPYSYKSDVWAVGVMTYQLMSLCVPFDARSMPELIRKILNTRPPNPNVNNRYSQDLCRMVASMLAKSPDRRPTLDQILTAPCFASRLNHLAKREPGILNFDKPATAVSKQHQEVAPGVTAIVTTTKTETATGHAVVTSVGSVGSEKGALAEVKKDVKEGYFDDAMQKLRAKQAELEKKIGCLQQEQVSVSQSAQKKKADQLKKGISDEAQKEIDEKDEMKAFIEAQKAAREANGNGDGDGDGTARAPTEDNTMVATDVAEELEKTVLALSEVCEEIHKMGAGAEEEKVLQQVAEAAQTIVAGTTLDGVEPHGVVTGAEEVDEEDRFDEAEASIEVEDAGKVEGEAGKPAAADAGAGAADGAKAIADK